MTFEEMIDKMLDNGIEITLKKENGVVWYDLNTGAKSHLWVAKSPNPGGDETAISQGRYGHKGSINTWSDLMWEVKDCLCGRDYMATNWEGLLAKEGILKVHTKTTTTYE
jgi:hypothetical protein